MTTGLALSSFVIPAHAHSGGSESPVTYTGAETVKGQNAEELASEYVAKAFEAWSAKTKASQARAEAAQAEEAAQESRSLYETARKKAAEALEDYEVKRQVSVNWIREMMRNPSTNINPSLQALTMDASDASALARNIQQVESINDIKGKAAMDADVALSVAEGAQLEAEQALADAAAAEAHAKELLEDSKKLEVDASATLQDAKLSLAEASLAVNSEEIGKDAKNKEDKSTSRIPASQRILNDAVAMQWSEYRSVLKKNSEILPDKNEVIATTGSSPFIDTASRMFLRSEAPPVQYPLFTEAGESQVGASRLTDGTVLISRAAMKRVDKAIDYLGTSYEDLTCQQLVSEVSGHKKTRDLNSLFTSAYQNKSIADTLPGDIVFFADAHGINQAGVSIGGGLVVVSSAASRTVMVVEVNENALISTRPGIDYDKEELKDAPTSNEENAIAWECGGISSSFGSVTGVSWVLPYGDRDHTVEVEYGDEDSRFKNDVSPGILLTSKKSDVVQAAFAGVVRVKETEKRGKTVTIRYNDNITVRYSGLAKTSITDGTFVGVGDPIGITGKSGSYFKDSKTPSVFVEVMIEGEPIDGEFMFFPPDEAGAEGYPNGLIPKEVLCPIDIGSHILRCDAAQSFKALNVAFRAKFDRDIVVTDSYRSLESQKRLKKQKPVLAATPGRSNHGWGLAVDLGGEINSFGTEEYEWMLENAPTFGWENPEWAQKGGSKPEAWHFEFFSAAQ